MNLKNKFSKYFLLFISVLISIVVIFLLTTVYFKKYEQQLEQNKKQILGAISKTATSQNSLKSLQYKKLSPDKSQEIVVYRLKFDPALYDDYYRDYFPNNTVIAVRNIKTQDEDYLFTGEERTGEPHWLNDSYIFFSDYCGSSCKGLYLIDTLNKTSKHAVISYFFEKNGPWQTHFKDWFGENFVFPGLIKNIEAKLDKGKAILIFKRDNGWGTDLEDKLFVFEENKLIPLRI